MTKLTTALTHEEIQNGTSVAWTAQEGSFHYAEEEIQIWYFNHPSAFFDDEKQTRNTPLNSVHWQTGTDERYWGNLQHEYPKTTKAALKIINQLLG